MKIKWQLTLLFGIIFCLLAALTIFLFKERPKILLIAELGVLVLMGIFYAILMRITKPLDQLALGIDSIKDQDFSGYLRSSGSKETDILVEVYNQMLTNIRKERTYQQEQHFFLQNLLQVLPVGLLILDFDNKIKDFNLVAQKVLQLMTESRGLTLQQTNALLKSELMEQKVGESVVYNLGGSNYIRAYVDRFKYRGFYQQFIIVQQAGDEILKVEKQSYGKVIRMMAHEVKNSVGAINSILETFGNTSELSEEDKKEYLNIVIERNLSLNSFIDNFAKVIRLPFPEKTAFSLSAALESVYYLMKVRQEDKDIHFELIKPKEEVIIQGSKEQIEQALINILLNAYEAIPKSGDVSIILEPNKLLVIDNGTGINAETQEKLFTPFYSTKATGQGVGLTMVREILHNHGFRFKLNSENGITTFEIQF